MSELTIPKAARVIVNVMCNRGFMNGWFGDVGAEFRDEQVSGFLSMTPPERVQWIENNRFNLRRYCRVPEWLLARACEPL